MSLLAQSVMLVLMVVGTIVVFLLLTAVWSVSRKFLSLLFPDLIEPEATPEPADDFVTDENLRLAIICAAIHRYETERWRVNGPGVAILQENARETEMRADT